MSTLPKEFEARLSESVQGLRDLVENQSLTSIQGRAASEALDLFEIMLEKPGLALGLAGEWQAREDHRRTQASIQQGVVIWRRVASTLSEAVDVSREIGRVAPEMIEAVKEMEEFVSRNLTELSKSAPLMSCMDLLEVHSQRLRSATRDNRAEFHGSPHPDHGHTALLSELAASWKEPAGPTKFLSAIRKMHMVWAQVCCSGGVKPSSMRPSV